ncbi:MAG: hypothetical protein ACKOEO_01820, partial [Planctomycetaceae bacterium]
MPSDSNSPGLQWDRDNACAAAFYPDRRPQPRESPVGFGVHSSAAIWAPIRDVTLTHDWAYAECESSATARFNVMGHPNGVDVLWNPMNRRVKTRDGEAPAEPPHAGARG